MSQGEISNVNPDRPAYLQEIKPEQVDNTDLNLFAKPPRIRWVQALSRPPLKPAFKDGDIVLVPQMTKIGDGETPLTFIVIHFFPSWVCLNPIQMAGALPSIREFSLDPQSDVAKIAKSFKPVACPENAQYQLKYNETLNFMVVLPDSEFCDIPIHLFFSRGEYKTGQMLIGMIQARKAPRYACRFRAVTGNHTGRQGNWFGLDIMNDPKPWVENVDEFNKYEKLYKELKTLVDSRSIELDLEDMNGSEIPETGEF